ncbi:hypothetical protein [Roseivirga sp.]|uniref:hypothetical protein n=1 Tax=Roseivirga sp. TaxID=1964215 RepID=UPI003B51E990
MIIHKLKVAGCLVIVSVLAGCSGSPVNDVEVEPGIIKESLVAEQFLEQEIGMAPYIVGPYLLIKQNQNRVDRVVFSVYNSKDLSYLGSLGERGREGPDTFYGASYWGQHIEREGEYLIWVNDPPRFRISLINITKSLQEGRTVIERRVTHKPEYDFMNALFVVDSVGLVGHQPGYQNGTNMAPLVMLRNGEFQLYGEYPEVTNVQNPEQWRNGANFNNINLSMRPDQSRFAVAMRHYDRLDIFNNVGNKVASYIDNDRYRLFDYGEIYDSKMYFMGTLKNYYIDSWVTQEFIFTLYYNATFDEDKEFHPSTIRVFDWDGNLRAELACPDHIWSISVDEEKGFLYAGSAEQEALFRYDIKSILNQLFKE